MKQECRQFGQEFLFQENCSVALGMEKLSTTVSLPRVVRERDCSVLKVLAANVQFLIGPQECDENPCILKGAIAPGASVPIHSHDSPEVFFILSGNIEVLLDDGGNLRWVEARAGELIEMPSNAKHGFRNRSREPVSNLVFTTSRHGRYFQEIGKPVISGESVQSPTPDEIEHFRKVAERYGYWLATPEENASFGIYLPPGDSDSRPHSSTRAVYPAPQR